MEHLQTTDFILGSISDVKDKALKNQVEIWVSADNLPSYDLLETWRELTDQVPEILDKVEWEPRYALTRCHDPFS